MSSVHKIRRNSLSGQAMAEFVVVLLPFYLLIFGAIQTALIYSAKTALNYATFQAARIGAVNNATYTGIRKGLIRGLAPLYTHSDSLDDLNYDILRGETGEGTGGNLKNAATEVDGYTRIIRLSPMASAFESGSSGFGEQNEDGIMFIPSDNLMYRDPSPSSGGFNIQDANLLKIKVQYCYELIVHMVNKIIGSLSQLNNTKTSGFHPMIDDTDPRFSDANEFAADELQGSSGLASYDELCSGGDIGYDRVDSHKGFVISAEAIVRMQSPAYETDPDEELGDRMCQKPYMVCP